MVGDLSTRRGEHSMQALLRLANHARSQRMPSGVLMTKSFLVISSYFTEGHVDLPREAIGPKGPPITSRGGSVPEILRKSTATCYYSGGGGEWGRIPCLPSWSAHANMRMFST